MTDINGLMSRALLLGGVTLPACEDPMRGDVAGDAYITWTNAETRELWSSGVRFQRRYNLRVTLWVLDDGVDWLLLRDQMIAALDGFSEQGATILTGSFTGAQGWDATQGRAIELQVLIVDDLWSAGAEGARADAADG